jgi:hypothetical protein
MEHKKVTLCTMLNVQLQDYLLRTSFLEHIRHRMLYLQYIMYITSKQYIDNLNFITMVGMLGSWTNIHQKY